MFLSILIIFIISFIITYAAMGPIIRRVEGRGLVGKDMNKLRNPEIPELGGVGVLFGFIMAMMAAIFIFHYLETLNFDLQIILAGFCTILIIGFLGLVDDLIGWKHGVKQWQHALIPLFAALPLMALKVGTATMIFPFVGAVTFGIWYSLIIVPIGVTGASNAFNMLAGFNGLEAGQGILIGTTFLAIALMTGSVEVVVIMTALLGALIAFLRFNWFPAKIFGGDTLTLPIGASFAVAAIVGNMEKIAVLLFAIYFIELLLKAKTKFKAECFGIPQKDGTLKADPKGGSITHVIMKMGKFKEQHVTLIILGMQTCLCILTFALFYFRILVV
ncbi:MAG: glycosyltransferase 4 family protein [Candidatus Diapherotrites archaeon]